MLNGVGGTLKSPGVNTGSGATGSCTFICAKTGDDIPKIKAKTIQRIDHDQYNIAICADSTPYLGIKVAECGQKSLARSSQYDIITT